MDPALIDLYHRHVAADYDRQVRFGDFLEAEEIGEEWEYTISTATLLLGGHLQFEALDLGSHAEPDNSWLWAWCNPHLKLTPANKELSEAVRQLGRDFGIAVFGADRQVSCAEHLGEALSPDTPHIFAAIVVGSLEFDAHYAVKFKYGWAVVVIRDPRLQARAPDPVARILSIFPRVLARRTVLDHRAAFEAYVRWYGFAVEETPEGVRVLADGKEVLTATFDEQRRMTELKGKLGAD
jgi:hypothetical protein